MNLMPASDGVPAQFGTPDTDNYQTITIATQLDGGGYYINPINGSAWIKLTDGTNTPADGEGLYVSTPMSIRVPEGYYLGSSDDLNVVPYI